MRDLAAQGHQLIFATSFGYLEPALRVAAEYPNVRFEHAGGYKTAANLGTYNARYYEARYLAGLLAGQAAAQPAAAPAQAPASPHPFGEPIAFPSDAPAAESAGLPRRIVSGCCCR